MQLVRVECVEDQQLERVHQEMLKQLLKVYCFFFDDSAFLVECKFVGVQACLFVLNFFNWFRLACPILCVYFSYKEM